MVGVNIVLISLINLILVSLKSRRGVVYLVYGIILVWLTLDEVSMMQISLIWFRFIRFRLVQVDLV